MAKDKKTSKAKKDLSKSAKKSFGSRPIVWIVLGLLLVVVVIMLVMKDEEISLDDPSDELDALSDACSSYAQSLSRTEFCKYRLINGDLINCRDSRVLEELASDGIDTNLGSLNCGSIDIYTFRKDACLGYSADTKIADTTCADYQ